MLPPAPPSCPHGPVCRAPGKAVPSLGSPGSVLGEAIPLRPQHPLRPLGLLTRDPQSTQVSDLKTGAQLNGDSSERDPVGHTSAHPLPVILVKNTAVIKLCHPTANPSLTQIYLGGQ